MRCGLERPFVARIRIWWGGKVDDMEEGEVGDSAVAEVGEARGF